MFSIVVEVPAFPPKVDKGEGDAVAESSKLEEVVCDVVAVEAIGHFIPRKVRRSEPMRAAYSEALVEVLAYLGA